MTWMPRHVASLTVRFPSSSSVLQTDGRRRLCDGPLAASTPRLQRRA